MRVTVFGATGSTGSRVVDAMRGRGVTIRVVSRSEERAAALKADEFAIWGDTVSAYETALEGADAAYFMLPTGLLDGSLFAFRDHNSRAFAQAAGNRGTARVVFLSSFGAHLSANSGVLEGLCKAEQNLRGFGGDLVVIRPGYFWENFRGNIQGVRNGFLGGYPIEPETELLFSSVNDVGRIAADLLVADTVETSVRYVGYPETYTFRTVGRAIAGAVGRDGLEWMNVGYDAARNHMESNGMPADLVTNLIAFFDAINRGTVMDDYTPDQLIAGEWGLARFTAWFASEFSASTP